PATPFRWAEKMAAELNASLVTFDGEGHSSVTRSDCVAAAAAALLVELDRPAPGLSCGADPPSSAPPWWHDQPRPPGFDLSDATGVTELLGFPPEMYADVLHAPEGAGVDEIAAALAESYEDAGWAVLATEDLPIGDDAVQVVVTREDEIVALTVLGPAALDTPAGAAFAAYSADGRGLVLRFNVAL